MPVHKTSEHKHQLPAMYSLQSPIKVNRFVFWQTLWGSDRLWAQNRQYYWLMDPCKWAQWGKLWIKNGVCIALHCHQWNSHNGSCNQKGNSKGLDHRITKEKEPNLKGNNTNDHVSCYHLPQEEDIHWQSVEMGRMKMNSLIINTIANNVLCHDGAFNTHDICWCSDLQLTRLCAGGEHQITYKLKARTTHLDGQIIGYKMCVKISSIKGSGIGGLQMTENLNKWIVRWVHMTSIAACSQCRPEAHIFDLMWGLVEEKRNTEWAKRTLTVR